MFCWCKVREWVWTETGKGDRLGGDSRVGPSPFSERPAPPHSLHRTSRTIPEAGQLHMPACCAVSRSNMPVRICLAMPHLLAFVMTPCLLALFALPLCSPTHHVRQDHPGKCLQRLPCRQPHTGDCVCAAHASIFLVSIPAPMTLTFFFHRSPVLGHG